MASKTWQAMTEAHRDSDRNRIRAVLTDQYAALLDLGDGATALDRSAVAFLEACLAADRIELGLAFFLLTHHDMADRSDLTLGALRMVGGVVDRLDALMGQDPQRN